MKCEYCEGTGEIETDNNGPITPCPVCKSSRSPDCSTADELLEQIRHDLLWRAEEEDSDGCKVVDLSCGLWMKLNRYLDRRR